MVTHGHKTQNAFDMDKKILLESQLQKTVGTDAVMFHHNIQFYLVVGLFTHSKTSALANK